MGWIALSIFILACAVGTGLTNIANALYNISVKHQIGKITIEQQKARYPSHDDRTTIKQII
jgi:hypothetical protein